MRYHVTYNFTTKPAPVWYYGNMKDAKLTWQERVSESKFVASVWRCDVLAATSRTVLADPCVSIDIIKSPLNTRAILRGPTTKPYRISLETGYTHTGIRLHPGVTMQDFSAQEFLDRSWELSVNNGERVGFKNTQLQLPDFDTAEDFIEQLHRMGYLSYEVSAKKAVSIRSHSRLVKRTTGLSPYRLLQVQRAHQALRLLKEGVPAATVAVELNFVDESHLTRVVKQFLGHTPKQLLYLPQTP